MHYFRDLSIKRKLTVIIMTISGASLLAACVALAIYERATSRRTIAQDFQIIANMLVDDVAPGLAFNDPASVAHTLKTLSGHPHVESASVFDKAGKIVSEYYRSKSAAKLLFPASQAPIQRFAGDRLETFRGISLDGETLGFVYIRSDLNELHDQTKRYVMVIAVLLAVCSLAAFLLTARLQKLISQPIIDLARTAGAVTAEKNYSLRAIKRSDDEVGKLIDGFNDMLGQIQERDVALRAARDDLEKRVLDRTRELQHEVGERKLAESFMISVLDHLPIAVFIKEAKDLRFVLWNKSGEELCGYTAAEMAGKNDYDFFSTAQADSFVTKDRETLQSRALVELEEDIMSRSNGKRIIRTRKVPILDDRGQPLYLLGISEDITERKAAEAELAATHKQLLTASRQAGMAEVATGVLHNVGNVLNSVNVSTTIISDRVRKSKSANLSRVASLIQEHASDLGSYITIDPKGKQLPGYLKQLAEHLDVEQAALLKELEHLKKNVDHIKEIVAMQQSHSKVSGVTELVKLTELAEDTLKINAATLARHGVEIVRKYEPNLPDIMVEKHKVLQILINLVRNADHACEDSGREDKRLTVRIGAVSDRVKISVADNGVGIPAENLIRIFNHGFTTRKEGHGFGLHSGALAAKEIGGSLGVRSDGPGLGAEFTLELPLQPAKSAANGAKP